MGDYQSVLIILMFGVPLFDFVVLTAVFSHPVIRGLGVAVVDEDRSDTSRAFIEQVAASPSLPYRSTHRRPRIGRAGDTIGGCHRGSLHPCRFRARPQG